MANLNKVMLIGRLTRDPEPILNGKGAKFGFAVNNRKLNDKQEWEDVPVFIDMEIWNRGEMGKQADRVLQTLKRGHQVFIEGHLKMDQWEDKNGGGKRTALRVVVENFQYLERREDGGEGQPRPAARPAYSGASNGNRGRPTGGSYSGGGDFDDGADMAPPPSKGSNKGGSDEDIPF